MGTQWAAAALQQGLVQPTVSQNPGGLGSHARQPGFVATTNTAAGRRSLSCAKDASVSCRPLTGHSQESLVSREQLLWERQDALWQQEVQRSVLGSH